MLSLKQSVTQTGLQRLFLHKLQGDHMWSQTSSQLRSWDLTLPHTILNCKIYIKADKKKIFHWISCFERNCIFCLRGLPLLKLREKLDLSQSPSCAACQLCQAPWGWQCPPGRDVVPGHANRCGAEDPGITGSVAQEQPAKPLGPHFPFGRKPDF